MKKAKDAINYKTKLESNSKKVFNQCDYRKLSNEFKTKRVSTSATAAIQNEFLTINKKDCANSRCNECGVKQKLQKTYCALEDDTSKMISSKQYVKQRFLDEFGNEIELQQKELRNIHQTVPTFVGQFYEFLSDEYLPYNHVSK